MARLEQLKEFFETNFKILGLEIEVVKNVVSPFGESIFCNLKYMSQYNEKYIKSCIEKIAVYSHLDMSFQNTKEAHFLIFVKQRSQHYLSLTLCLNEVNFREMVLGKNSTNELIKLDFDKTPHLLIAGSTGSGKSVLLHNILVNIGFRYATNYGGTAERFKRGAMVFVIDTKFVEFEMYRNVYKLVNEVSEAIDTLHYVEQEMDKRYQEHRLNDYDIFVVVDELADLMLVSKFEVEKSLVRIAQKGRACGIHLIVATQRPTIDVVSGLIKANMPYRIALKTASVRDSVVILDHKGAEELDGCGDCIVKLGNSEQHGLIAFPEKELEAKLIDKRG